MSQPTFDPIKPSLNYGLGGVETPIIGYQVGGVDIAHGVDDRLLEDLKSRLHTHGLLVLDNQDLDEAAQIEFASRLGKFAQHVPEDKVGYATYFDSERPGTGQGELLWHSDYNWLPHPLKYIMMFGIEVPLQGGQTLFASTADALDRMPEYLVTELESCTVQNTSPRSGETFVRPAIERHWASGRPYLTVDRVLTVRLNARSPERGEELRQLVYGVMYDSAFVVRHTWKQGDLVIFDNRLLHHSRSHFELAERRLIRRCAIADDNDPSAVQFAA